eukprot:TRINITY_DN90971_c0_g1_i1.p1 TRINITY_DN90971_c0_g1~~TRINITY_DN90971_c0_g1_i1.p1  ORF type:complete len:652 (-),score=119.46 TRINITY_DN90971_c0_g1_i1:62-1927(-)
MLAAAATGAHSQSLVQSLDMYRAMEMPADGKETNPVSNNNLADAMGVLRYIHQEVVVEHTAGSPDRVTRKYGINSIGRYRMKVRNPDSILQDKNQEALPGFGRYGAFDFGVATSMDLLQNVVADGDYVGISVEDSPQINFTHPWYWFSVNGECPNLPWTCVPPFAGCTEKNPPTKPAQCDPDGCAGKFDKDAQTCPIEPQFTDPTDTEALRSCCLRYVSAPDQVVQGGLCKDETEPTGKNGCAYTYKTLSKKDFVSLEDLNGITSMPCGQDGERKCKDWYDWRHHCYDPDSKYHSKFTADGTKQATSYCVEYDLHPACQSSVNLCKDPKCMALKPEEKEVGLEFWLGKCEVAANQRRAEAVVGYFLKDAVKHNHLLVDEALMKASPQCASTDEKMPNQCTPNENGGPYCTRVFGGVCSGCYIPGTKVPYNDTAKPFCPYTVLKEKGNVDYPAETNCKSRDPFDFCCLYGLDGWDCNSSLGTKGSNAELSAAGFLVVSRLQSQKEMEAFANRYIASQGGWISDGAGFTEAVYRTWHYQPPTYPDVAWASFISHVNESSAVGWGPKPGMGAGAIIAIVLVALVVGALLGCLLYRGSRRRAEARSLLEADNERPPSTSQMAGRV